MLGYYAQDMVGVKGLDQGWAISQIHLIDYNLDLEKFDQSQIFWNISNKEN